MGILQKSQINYFLKTSLDGYFKLTSDTSVNQCHSKVEKSGGQTMAQNTGKSDFFCIISTALTETGGGKTIALFYGKNLQVCFWKIRI